MPDIMGQMDIAFPNIGIYLKNVPKSFEIFGISIAMYGVIIGLGFFLALLLISKMAKVTGQNSEDYWDVAVYIIVFSIIGARLYYVFFSWDYYKDNPISILYLRNGGLAIYGGVIHQDQKEELPSFWRHHNVWSCPGTDPWKMGQLHQQRGLRRVHQRTFGHEASCGSHPKP